MKTISIAESPKDRHPYKAVSSANSFGIKWCRKDWGEMRRRRNLRQPSKLIKIYSLSIFHKTWMSMMNIRRRITFYPNFQSLFRLRSCAKWMLDSECFRHPENVKSYWIDNHSKFPFTQGPRWMSSLCQLGSVMHNRWMFHRIRHWKPEADREEEGERERKERRKRSEERSGSKQRGRGRERKNRRKRRKERTGSRQSGGGGRGEGKVLNSFTRLSSTEMDTSLATIFFHLGNTLYLRFSGLHSLPQTLTSITLLLALRFSCFFFLFTLYLEHWLSLVQVPSFIPHIQLCAFSWLWTLLASLLPLYSQLPLPYLGLFSFHLFLWPSLLYYGISTLSISAYLRLFNFHF